MAKLKHRETRFRHSQETAEVNPPPIHLHHVGTSESDALPYIDAALHHHISGSRNHPLNLFHFSRTFPGDLASKVWLEY
jgi:hypothetical protein